MVILESGDTRLEVDEGFGGRLASLRIGGLEILVTDSADPLGWGCYPMAPWASRVRNGAFEFAGRRIALPLRRPPHAIHGTVLDRAWVLREASPSRCLLDVDLGEAWPWPGSARQTFALSDTGLDCRLEVAAEDAAFPAVLGWHPWFRRTLERGDSLELDFRARSIYRNDETGLPTGETETPGPGPFDDCFSDVLRAPVLRWPGALELSLSTNLDHWIVYSLPEHAVCVEPVSGPPDAFNLATRSGTGIDLPLVEPGRPLVGEFHWRWKSA